MKTMYGMPLVGAIALLLAGCGGGTDGMTMMPGGSTGGNGATGGSGGSGGGGDVWTGAAAIEFRKNGVRITDAVLIKQITSQMEVVVLNDRGAVLNLSKFDPNILSLQPSMVDAALDASMPMGMAQLTSKMDIFDMGSEPTARIRVSTREVSAELATTSVIKVAGPWKVTVVYKTGGGAAFGLNIEQTDRELKGEKCRSGSSCTPFYTGSVQDKTFSFKGNPSNSGEIYNGTFTDINTISGSYSRPDGAGTQVGDFLAKRM